MILSSNQSNLKRYILLHGEATITCWKITVLTINRAHKTDLNHMNFHFELGDNLLLLPIIRGFIESRHHKLLVPLKAVLVFLGLRRLHLTTNRHTNTLTNTTSTAVKPKQVTTTV